MTQTEQTDLERARRLASTAHVLAVLAALLLSLAVLAQYFIPAGAVLWHGAGPFSDRLSVALIALIPAAPTMLFIGAVLKLRLALEEYGDGAFFSRKAARHVAGAGEEAAWALAAQVAIVPTVLAWVRHEGGFAMKGEPYMLGMFAFALFVMLVGRVLAAAAAIKAENDEIV